MSQGRIKCGVLVLTVLVIAVAGCIPGPDLGSPQVQQAWLRANDEKIVETLRREGLQFQKTGESQFKVAEYSRHGKGVCVIFVDGKNEPPQAASAAYLLPTSEDGSSWMIAGYVMAGGTGGKMKTVTFEKSSFIFEKSITEEAPYVDLELDMYLAGRGIKREKLPAEEVMIFF